MNWSSLPLELQEKILIYLPRVSVPQCRQVCKSWKNFIETRLNKNMFGEVPKYVKTEETIEVDVVGNKRKCYIKAVFENNVVFLSDDTYNRKNYQNLMVYNVVSKDTWRMGNIGPISNGRFAELYVYINKTLLAICYKSDINLLGIGHKILKVFSMDTKEILFEDMFPDILRKVQIDRSSSLLALLYSTKVEVLSFNNNLFSRFSCNTQVPVNFDSCFINFQDVVYDDNYSCIWSTDHLMFPYLCHCEVNEEDAQEKTQTSAFVWKIDDQEKKVKRHKYFADFGSCLQLTYDKTAIEEAIYVSSSFAVVTVEPGEEDDHLVLLKILNDDGELLRRIQLKNHTCDIQVYTFGRRLVLNSPYSIVESEGATNMFDLRELLGSDANNNVSVKSFPEINHNQGWNMLDFTSVARIEFENLKLKVTRLDFWDTNQFSSSDRSCK